MGKKSYKKRKLTPSPSFEGNPSEDPPSSSEGNPQTSNSSFHLSPEEYLQLAEEYSSIPTPHPTPNLTLPPPLSPTPPPPLSSTPSPPPTTSPPTYSSKLKTSLKTPVTSSGNRPEALPKFKAVPVGGKTSYAAVRALEDQYPDIKIIARPNLNAEFIITPKNSEAAEILKMRPDFQLMDPCEKLTKAYVLRYYASLPLDPITDLQNVVTAERITAKGGIPISKVLVTFRGPVPDHLQLKYFGSFPTEKFTPEPLRCYNCNRFGHHKTRCMLPATCGVCSGRHLTEVCLTKHKNGQKTTAKCPNCREAHHAWFKGCPARLERINPRDNKKTNLPVQPNENQPKPAKTSSQSLKQIEPTKNSRTSTQTTPVKKTTNASTQTTPAVNTAERATQMKPSSTTSRATKTTVDTKEATTATHPPPRKSRSIQTGSGGLPRLPPSCTDQRVFLHFNNSRKDAIWNMLLRVQNENTEYNPVFVLNHLFDLLSYFAKLDNPELGTPVLPEILDEIDINIV